ncbi:MAG: hypothetical protein RLZZ387_2815 [Chloroflexota bacterium]|jgi:hypothetical protein
MIKLTRSAHESGGQHHWIPLEWISRVDGIVMLDRPAEQAMREWGARGPRKASA